MAAIIGATTAKWMTRLKPDKYRGSKQAARRTLGRPTTRSLLVPIARGTCTRGRARAPGCLRLSRARLAGASTDHSGARCARTVGDERTQVGPEYEMDPRLCSFWGGTEMYWSSRRLDWLIYL